MVGDLVEDIVVRSAVAPVPATDNPARIDRVRGGSAANVAAGAARTGAAVRFIGRVGVDAVGERLVAELAATGVDVRVQHGERTGAIAVLVVPGGERTMFPDRAAAAELGPIEESWLAGVTWLHVPAYSLCVEPIGTSTRGAIGLVRRAGGRVSVDVSSASLVATYGAKRFTALVRELAPAVVFANAAEAATITGPLPGVVVVKDGPRPVTVRTPDGRREMVAVPPVSGVADTTGAGDAFAAGYLTAAMAGAPPGAAAAAGIALAARTLAVAGAGLE